PGRRRRAGTAAPSRAGRRPARAGGRRGGPSEVVSGPRAAQRVRRRAGGRRGRGGVRTWGGGSWIIPRRGSGRHHGVVSGIIVGLGSLEGFPAATPRSKRSWAHRASAPTFRTPTRTAPSGTGRTSSAPGADGPAPRRANRVDLEVGAIPL